MATYLYNLARFTFGPHLNYRLGQSKKIGSIRLMRQSRDILKFLSKWREEYGHDRYLCFTWSNFDVLINWYWSKYDYVG